MQHEGMRGGGTVQVLGRFDSFAELHRVVAGLGGRLRRARLDRLAAWRASAACSPPPDQPRSDLAQLLAIDDEVDRGDAPGDHGEADDRGRPLGGAQEEARGAVDDRRPCERREARGARQQLARHRRAPTAGGRACGPRPASTRKTTSGSSTSSSASKSPARAAARKAVTTSRWRPRSGSGDGRRAAHAPARAAGELARGRGRAVDDRGDLVERHAEHVVQHEGEALGGGQRVEDDEQGEPDRVGQLGLVGRVGVLAGGEDRLGQPGAHELLAPCPARAQHVQAHAGDDRRQPAAQVGDGVGVGAAEAQPRLLDGVVGLAERAEHPVGDRAQMRPVLLELLGLVLVSSTVTSSRRGPS